MDRFVHLHVHSDYSALDGAARIRDMVARAAELEQPALALTDHGNVFGGFEFYQQCIAAGIKPIMGMECYVAPESRHVKSQRLWGDSPSREDVGGSGAHTHLTVVARTAEGLRNLYRLHCTSFDSGFYRKARIDLDCLREYGAGLVVATGCPGSATSTRLKLGQREPARQSVASLIDAVGKENVYVEVMEHGLPVEALLNPQLIEMATELDLPLLATNDLHYVLPEDAVAHDALLCIQTGARLGDSDRFRFEGSGYYLKSRREMDALCLPVSALDNTLLLAERVEDYGEVFSQRLERMPRLPDVDDPTRELRRQVYESSWNWPLQYDERLEFELGVIEQMDFAGYFLVLGDICGFARTAGIRIGVRGSANGSLVAFALGITGIDPIEHGLFFERFLTPERKGLPDIDVDVDDTRRGEILEYIRKRFGDDRAAQIITYSRIGARRAIGDSARVHDLPYSMGKSLCTRLPRAQYGRQPTIAEGDWRNLSADESTVITTARGLEGLIRQPGVHAAGVVISSVPLADVIPVWRQGGKGGLVSGYDHKAMEPLGLVKFDLLGLRNLSVIDETLRMVTARRTATDGGLLVVHQGEPATLPDTFDDAKTYSLLQRGETLGVFQLDSPGMRGLLRKVRPTGFGDISAVLALYRPGPMGVDAHNSYARRKAGSERIDYIDPELEVPLRPILGETYGLIVYQEQVMQILQDIGGYTAGEASVLLKIFKYKDREALASEEARFKGAAISRGIPPGAVAHLWDTIVPFADYAFNKAHATGYGQVAYWTAYLKANHPVEYMAALLGSVADDPNLLPGYLAETTRMQIRFLPPDINDSGIGFTPVGDGIRYGLSAIHGVGEKVAAGILAKRPYRDIDDFFRRTATPVLNSGVLTALTKSGAFDSLVSREGMLDTLGAGTLLERVVNDRKERGKGQAQLFAGGYRIPRGYPDKHRRQILESETLGVVLTGLDVTLHRERPLDRWEMEYVKRIVDQNPGSQVMSLRFSLTTLRGVATLSLSPEARQALGALGMEVSEE